MLFYVEYIPIFVTFGVKPRATNGERIMMYVKIRIIL